MLKITALANDETTVYSLSITLHLMNEQGTFSEIGKIELLRKGLDRYEDFYIASFEIPNAYWRGRGYGGTLLRTALYHARVHGAKGAHWHDTSQIDTAHRLYEKYATYSDGSHYRVEF